MPSSDVGSILKSPVMITVPTGVWMAKATASAMEWFTWMNSTGEAARLHDVAGVMGHELGVLLTRSCSSSLSLMRPSVSGVACTGALTGLQHIRQRADVVLVAVGDEEAAELLLVFRKIGDVRNDKVHAVHVVLGEAEAAVDDDHVLAVFQHGHVLADLIQTAERK